LITERGYEEQARSYLNMESAADMAASAEKKAATGALIGAGFDFAAAIATLGTFGGGGGGGGGDVGAPMSLAPPPPQQFGPFQPPAGLQGVY
jgi:hypothetical protein